MSNIIVNLQGVDLDKLIETGQYISEYLSRPNGSKVGQARAPGCER